MKTVKITSVERNNSVVTVTGITENLGFCRVEIIINDDLNLRYVADHKDDGTWICNFELPYNGEYRIEASIRDYSDFDQIRQITPDDNYFMLEECNVWGATAVKHTDGLYYMIFAVWDTHDGFTSDWYHYSELGYAVSTRLGGPYIYQGKTLDATYCNTTHDRPVSWSYGTLDVFHNPTLMYSEKDGKYYLYFMGTSTSDMEKSHSRQRIGVAYADNPAGPWTIMDEPVIDIRENWEWSMTANPSVTEVMQEDGSYLYYAVYKGSGTYEGQRLTATGYGTSDSPLGPFARANVPIMRDPEVGFSVEDCYVWHQNGKFYALAKDMTKGNWTGVTEAYSYALFESNDGEKWALSDHNLAFRNEIPWASGTQVVSNLERSQLYTVKGIPFQIFNATTINGQSPYEENQSYNVQIPLLGVALAADTYNLTIDDLKEKVVTRSGLQQLWNKSKLAEASCFTNETWKRLKSAEHAAEIVLARQSAEQKDVDFVIGQLQKLL